MAKPNSLLTYLTTTSAPPCSARASSSWADDGLSLTCPNHQTTAHRYQTEGKGGFDFHFPAKLCRICPLSDQCRGPEAKKTAPRNVFISFYRDQVEPTLRFNQTETFKRGIKIRMHIERIIYCLTHIYGTRKAQSDGQPRVDFQLKMQVTAFNLRQLVRELLKKQHPTLAAVRPGTA